MTNLADVTLQINISPGDIRYAALTVPTLVAKHRNIAKRLLVVDCCRPQKTKIIDPDRRYPKAEFEQKVLKVIAIAEKLLADGVVTEVYFLKPDTPLIPILAKKYLRNLYHVTHSAGGTANMSYWAGIELPSTRYVLHYDGDMLIYEAENYDWVSEALQLMNKDEQVVMAVPRLCPPITDGITQTSSFHEGRPLIDHPDFWLSDWFSTRHFLLDKQKFNQYLPLPKGKVLLHLLLRKYGKRAFPIDPEILIFKSMAPRGAKRLLLKNKAAWLLHPTDKGQDFIDLLPQLIEAINRGESPEAQIGYEDLNLKAWVHYFGHDKKA